MKKLFTNSLIALLPLPLLAFNFANTPKQVSAYYNAPSQELNLLISKLENNGFNILATTHILENNNIITISNEELKNTNSYMATLQLNLNSNSIEVQNPSYLAAAYLGESYYYGQFKNTVNALERVLGVLNDSHQKAEFSTLSQYRFMYGLPKREDILTITKDNDLQAKIANNKYIAYTLALPNGSILVGHKLRANTNRFLKVLGQEHNAQLLPYEAMIKGDEVTIMNPKYYLALSLPLLSLHEFMQIAAVPDKIYRNIKKAYQ